MSAPPPRSPSVSPGRTIAAAAGSIAVITLVARVVGFGRWFAFSHSVGATCVGSVYQSVNAVPNVLYEIAAGGVLAAVAVPIVSAALARGDRDEADRTASALLTWALVVLLPVGVLVAVVARPIAELLLGGVDGCAGAVDLGAGLLRIFAVQIPLYGVGIVLGGVLQSHRRFVGAALAPLLSSLVVIATYLAYGAVVTDPAAAPTAVPAAATTVLALGTTLGVVALSLPLLLPLVRAGVRLRPTLTFHEEVGARVRRLAVAGLLAVAGQQLATLVVIGIANGRGGPGTLNVWTYVQAVALLPYAVLAVPLATAAFPTLARSAAAEEESPGRSRAAVDTLRRTWLATLLAGTVAVGLIGAVARPVGSFFVLLDAGRDDAAGGAALASVPGALVLSAPGILALSVIGLLSRASYVRGSARAAGAVIAGGWLATTVVPLAAHTGPLDPGNTLAALAIGSSTGLVAGALGLGVLVARAWGRDALAVPVRPVAAVLLGGAVATAAGWWTGGHWVPSGVGAAAVQCLVVGLGAVVVLGGITVAGDRSVLARLRGARPQVVTGGDRR